MTAPERRARGRRTASWRPVAVLLAVLSGSSLAPVALVAPGDAFAQETAGDTTVDTAQPVPDTIVRAVLFFSPTCPHCERVLNVELPPILERFGDRLRIVGLNTAVPDGQRAYVETVERLGVPPNRRGVPLLVVGSDVLVGAIEIPERLPGIVERALATGGIGWPDLPLVRVILATEGLLETPEPSPRLAAGSPGERDEAQPGGDARPASGEARAPAGGAPPVGEEARARGTPEAAVPTTPETRPGNGAVRNATPEATPDAGPELTPEAAPDAAPGAAPEVAPPGSAGPSSPGPVGAAAVLAPDGALPVRTPGPMEMYLRDPVANTVSLVVLGALLVVLALALAAAAGRARAPAAGPEWVTPALAILGIAIAAYLSYVEITGAEAVCGPVGDCNTVQQSSWARLFGIVPVGLLGMLGYALILGTWVAAWRSAGPARRAARLALWLLALVATAFSAWLTFLEPFVIGASCAWCLTSALLAGALLIRETRPAWDRA